MCFNHRLCVILHLCCAMAWAQPATVPATRPGIDIQQTLADCKHLRFEHDIRMDMNATIRAWYLNDQRIQWSGNESSFGAEADTGVVFTKGFDDGWIKAAVQCHLNVPYDRNLYFTPWTEAYRNNFHVDTFDLNHVYLQGQYKGFGLTMGKVPTRFAPYPFQTFSNQYIDTPYLWTDVIGFTQLGVFADYRIDWFHATIGIVNGTENLDNNSDKGWFGRLAVEQEQWSVGTSILWDNTTGSEHQKEYRNHVGIDAQWTSPQSDWGQWTVAGQFVYDQHGLTTPGLIGAQLADLGRVSIYGQDLNNGVDHPISGMGFNIGTQWTIGRWQWMANVGGYYPEHIGITGHDAPIYRGIGQIAWTPIDHLQLFMALIIENNRPKPQGFKDSEPFAIYFGGQFVW